MGRRTYAEAVAARHAVMERLLALGRALGLKPWQPSVASAEWTNPYPRGTRDHADAQEIRQEALKLERRSRRLGLEVERLHTSEIEKSLRPNTSEIEKSLRPNTSEIEKSLRPNT